MMLQPVRLASVSHNDGKTIATVMKITSVEVGRVAAAGREKRVVTV